MAATTYFSALNTAIGFMESHGYTDADVLKKLAKLRDQKATKAKTGAKSVTRTKNEALAQTLADTMREEGVDEIRAAWVRDNLAEVTTVPKAVAILNVAVDMGLLTSETRAKSATRNELVYKLA